MGKYLQKGEISLLVFGKRGKNKPNKCFVAGLDGCKKITENHLGYDAGGIEIINCTVVFDDNTKLEVNNPIYLTNLVIVSQDY